MDPGSPSLPSTVGGVDTPTDLDALIACHDCDLLHRRRHLAHGASARCTRCNALLYRRPADVVNRTLAFTVASAALFIVANAFPFMSFKIAGRVQVSHMITGAAQLWSDGYGFLAFMVLFTSAVAPLLMILALGYLTLPLALGRRPRGMVTINRWVGHLQPWSMMEVYMLGVIVSVIKLAQMADIVMGPAAWAFVGLMLTLTAAIAVFEPAVLWERIDTDHRRHTERKHRTRLESGELPAGGTGTPGDPAPGGATS